MKATLTFNLDDERAAFDYACNAAAIVLVIEDLLADLRQKVKYSTVPPHEQEILEGVRQQVFDLLREHGVAGLVG